MAISAKAIGEKIALYTNQNNDLLRQHKSRNNIKSMNIIDVANFMVKNGSLSQTEFETWLNGSFTKEQVQQFKSGQSVWLAADFGKTQDYVDEMSPLSIGNMLGFERTTNEQTGKTETKSKAVSKKKYNVAEEMKKQSFMNYIKSLPTPEATYTELMRSIEFEKLDNQGKMEMMLKISGEKFNEAKERGDKQAMKDYLLEGIGMALQLSCQKIDSTIGITQFKEWAKERSGLNFLVDLVDKYVDDGDDATLSWLEKNWEGVKGFGDALDSFLGTQAVAFIGALQIAGAAAGTGVIGQAFNIATKAYFLYDGGKMMVNGAAGYYNAETKQEARQAGQEFGMGTVIFTGTLKSVIGEIQAYRAAHAVQEGQGGLPELSEGHKAILEKNVPATVDKAQVSTDLAFLQQNGVEIVNFHPGHGINHTESSFIVKFNGKTYDITNDLIGPSDFNVAVSQLVQHIKGDAPKVWSEIDAVMKPSASDIIAAAEAKIATTEVSDAGGIREFATAKDAQGNVVKTTIKDGVVENNTYIDGGKTVSQTTVEGKVIGSYIHDGKTGTYVDAQGNVITEQAFGEAVANATREGYAKTYQKPVQSNPASYRERLATPDYTHTRENFPADAHQAQSKPGKATAYTTNGEPDGIVYRDADGKLKVPNKWDPEHPYEVSDGSNGEPASVIMIYDEAGGDFAVGDPTTIASTYKNPATGKLDPLYDVAPGRENAFGIEKDVVPSAYKIVEPGTEITTKEGPRVVQEGEVVVYDTDGDPYVMPLKNFLKRQEPVGDASQKVYSQLQAVQKGEAAMPTELVAKDGNATSPNAKTYVEPTKQEYTKPEMNEVSVEPKADVMASSNTPKTRAEILDQAGFSESKIAELKEKSSFYGPELIDEVLNMVVYLEGEIANGKTINRSLIEGAIDKFSPGASGGSSATQRSILATVWNRGAEVYNAYGQKAPGQSTFSTGNLKAKWNKVKESVKDYYEYKKWELGLDKKSSSSETSSAPKPAQAEAQPQPAAQQPKTVAQPQVSAETESIHSKIVNGDFGAFGEKSASNVGKELKAYAEQNGLKFIDRGSEFEIQDANGNTVREAHEGFFDGQWYDHHQVFDSNNNITNRFVLDRNGKLQSTVEYFYDENGNTTMSVGYGGKAGSSVMVFEGPNRSKLTIQQFIEKYGFEPTYYREINPGVEFESPVKVGSAEPVASKSVGELDLNMCKTFDAFAENIEAVKSYAEARGLTVKTVQNVTLPEIIFVDANGRTVRSLSFVGDEIFHDNYFTYDAQGRVKTSTSYMAVDNNFSGSSPVNPDGKLAESIQYFYDVNGHNYSIKIYGNDASQIDLAIDGVRQGPGKFYSAEQLKTEFGIDVDTSVIGTTAKNAQTKFNSSLGVKSETSKPAQTVTVGAKTEPAVPKASEELLTKLAEFKGPDGKQFLSASEINNLIENCQHGFITDGKPIPNYESKIMAVLNNPEEVAQISTWKSRAAGIWRAIQDPLSSTEKANPELFGLKQAPAPQNGNATSPNAKTYVEQAKAEPVSLASKANHVTQDGPQWLERRMTVFDSEVADMRTVKTLNPQTKDAVRVFLDRNGKEIKREEVYGGDIISTREEFLDADGNVIKTNYYSSYDGKLYREVRTEFNGDEKITHTKEYDSNGNVKEYYTNTRKGKDFTLVEYDAKGNTVRKRSETYTNSTKTNVEISYDKNEKPRQEVITVEHSDKTREVTTLDYEKGTKVIKKQDKDWNVTALSETGINEEATFVTKNDIISNSADVLKEFPGVRKAVTEGNFDCTSTKSIINTLREKPTEVQALMDLKKPDGTPRFTEGEAAAIILNCERFLGTSKLENVIMTPDNNGNYREPYDIWSIMVGK